MYRRNVSFELKRQSAAEFTGVLEELVIPLLRRQKGFEDEISFIAPERNSDQSLGQKRGRGGL